jgi:hypothetical protein
MTLPVVTASPDGTAVTKPAQGTEANTVAHHAELRSTFSTCVAPRHHFRPGILLLRSCVLNGQPAKRRGRVRAKGQAKLAPAGFVCANAS